MTISLRGHANVWVGVCQHLYKSCKLFIVKVKMFLVCHVTSREHMFKGLREFMDVTTKVSYHPAKFDGHRHCSSGDIMALVCSVI